MVKALILVMLVLWWLCLCYVWLAQNCPELLKTALKVHPVLSCCWVDFLWRQKWQFCGHRQRLAAKPDFASWKIHSRCQCFRPLLNPQCPQVHRHGHVHRKDIIQWLVWGGSSGGCFILLRQHQISRSEYGFFTMYCTNCYESLACEQQQQFYRCRMHECMKQWIARKNIHEIPNPVKIFISVEKQQQFYHLSSVELGLGITISAYFVMRFWSLLRPDKAFSVCDGHNRVQGSDSAHHWGFNVCRGNCDSISQKWRQKSHHLLQDKTHWSVLEWISDIQNNSTSAYLTGQNPLVSSGLKLMSCKSVDSHHLLQDKTHWSFLD